MRARLRHRRRLVELELKVEMSDSNDDLKLIREIVAHGGRKYTAGNIDRSR
jgi:hypothetical protein